MLLLPKQAIQAEQTEKKAERKMSESKCDCGIQQQGHVGKHLAGCPASESATYWIELGQLNSLGCYSAYDEHVDGLEPGAIEFIEYSAYEALKLENERLKKFHTSQGARDVDAIEADISGYKATIEKLQAENERFALELQNLTEQRGLAHAAINALTQELDALKAKYIHLKGDRDKWLASDDCYYWTPEGQAKRDRALEMLRKMAGALEDAASDAKRVLKIELPDVQTLLAEYQKEFEKKS